MATSARRRPTLLVDTSVAVALSVADHRHHLETSAAVAGSRLGLAGHAAFEAFSVLTRLPAPARRTPAAVARMLAVNFPDSRFIGEQVAAALLADMAARGIAGGSVYDALVATAATAHRLPLATRDRRALDTYRALGVEIELLT